MSEDYRATPAGIDRQDRYVLYCILWTFLGLSMLVLTFGIALWLNDDATHECDWGTEVLVQHGVDSWDGSPHLVCVPIEVAEESWSEEQREL